MIESLSSSPLQLVVFSVMTFPPVKKYYRHLEPMMRRLTRVGIPAVGRMCASSKNPVNVEDFTLNEEIVFRHLEIHKKWSTIGESLNDAKARKDFPTILDEATKGLEYFKEVGAEDAPLQCEPMLLMEASQAAYNMKSYDAAMQFALRAKSSIEGTRNKDMAKYMEIIEFVGHILLKQGKSKEAKETFEQVLTWIDVDSKSAMPMVSVAAREMRRTVLLGVGLSVEAEAQALEAEGNDAKPVYSAALDKLVESLDAHIEASDVHSVRDALSGCLRCFVGLKDQSQALDTCRKYRSWCERHQDPEGLEAVAGFEETIKKAFPPAN